MWLVSGRGYQEVGVASGWNLWVWLQCIGVASGCCKEYIDIQTIIINFAYSISSFLAAASLLLVHFLNVFKKNR